MAEALFTRYRILTSDDEGLTWKYVATVDANNRDTALRKHFTTPPETEVFAVAVAESSFRPMSVAVKVQTSLTEQQLPGDDVTVTAFSPDAVAVPEDEPTGALV